MALTPNVQDEETSLWTGVVDAIERVLRKYSGEVQRVRIRGDQRDGARKPVQGEPPRILG